MIAPISAEGNSTRAMGTPLLDTLAPADETTLAPVYRFGGRTYDEDDARAAYAAIAPVLRRREADLDAEIARRFAAVDAALRPYRSGAGFVSYTALERTEVRRLAQHIDALAEPLSRAPARALSA